MLDGGIPRISVMALVAKIHHKLLLYILWVRDVVILCKLKFSPRLILFSVISAPIPLCGWNPLKYLLFSFPAQPVKVRAPQTVYEFCLRGFA